MIAARPTDAGPAFFGDQDGKMMGATFRDGVREHELRQWGFTVDQLLDQRRLSEVAQLHASVGHAPDDPRAAIHFGFFSDDVAWKRAVTEGVRDIVGPRLDEVFDGQRMLFAMFVTKWPGHLGTFAPHQDPSFVDERIHRTATAWCPITPQLDANDHGRLHVVPGSHLLGPDVRVNDTSQFAHRDAERELLASLGVAVPLEPGEAIVFDNRTVHYSFPNRTSVPRVVLAVGLRPQEAKMFHFQASPSSPDELEVYDIDEEYFVEMNPLLLQLGGLPPEPSRTIRRPAPVPADEFVAACRSVGTPPRHLAPVATSLDDPPNHCYVCGATEGLLVDPDRGRGGMAVCGGCVEGVLGRHVAGAAEAPATGPAHPPEGGVVDADLRMSGASESISRNSRTICRSDDAELAPARRGRYVIGYSTIRMPRRFARASSSASMRMLELRSGRSRTASAVSNLAAKFTSRTRRSNASRTRRP